MKIIRAYHRLNVAVFRSITRWLEGIPVATGFALGALACVWMICALGLVLLAL